MEASEDTVNDALTPYEVVYRQEQSLIFGHFSRADALKVGLRLLSEARVYPDPIAVEITVNGLVVFRHFTDNSLPDSEVWLARKRRAVDRWAMSSLRLLYQLQTAGQTLSDRVPDPENYAAGGGGFPIVLKGTGPIGSICVSGLPNHIDDHRLIVDTLTTHLRRGLPLPSTP